MAWILFALSMSACENLEKEYSYTRASPAAGRRYPTEFTVRIQIKPDTRVVDWLEAGRDADGEIGQSQSIKHYSDCEIFDRANWKCWIFEKDYVEMVDGKLRQFYWGEDRKFDTHYRVINKLFKRH